MRREGLYLVDIIEAVDAIERFLGDDNEDAFIGNDLLRSAVLQKLTIIGEAAARLPQEFRDHYPEIPWSDIVGFRNIAIHAYFAVQWSIVWVAATEDAMELRERIREIIASEFPEMKRLGQDRGA
jgi:uncharacterized protein with HEPN domain